MAKYELFDSTEYCNAHLPVNPIQDEFTIVRFAQLLDNTMFGTIHPVVIPRDVVNPALMTQVRSQTRNLPYKVDLPTMRGGLPLNPDWGSWVAPPPPSEIQKFEILDRAQFFNKPEIQIGEVTYPIDLEAAHVQDLMTKGSTFMTLGEGDAEQLVELVLKQPVSHTHVATATTVQIDDLYQFLSDPRVHVETEATHTVALTQKNIEELTQLGVSRVEIPRGDSTLAVYVTADPLSQKGSSYLQLGGTVGGDIIKGIAWAFVLYLPYRQVWQLLGYSRGELLNSISLAPQEETTIEIFSWDRLTRTREDMTSLEQEGTMEVAFNDKDSVEVIKESANTTNWRLDSAGSATITTPIGIFNPSHDIEFRNELRDTNRATRQTVAEAVRKASARIKSTRQTKITESEEIGREERVTRKIRNPNMCRTLNLDYFEILATYEVTTELAIDQARLCVLMPNPIRAEIDRRFLLSYEGILRETLLWKRPYLEGFDAIRKLAAWERLCDIKCKEPCLCERPSSVHVGNAGPSGQSNPAAPTPAQSAQVLKAANDLRDSLGLLLRAAPADFCGLPYVNPPKAAWDAAKLTYHRWLYWQIITSKIASLPTEAATFWGANRGQQFTNVDQAATAVETFLTRINPSVGEIIFSSFTDILLLPVHVLLTTVKLLMQDAVCTFRLAAEVGVNDAGLVQALEAARNAVRTYRDAQNTSPQPAPSEEKKQETEQTMERGAPPEYSVKELAEAQVVEQALIDHIRSNEAYYRLAIWQSLDPQDQYNILSMFGSIMSYVDNEVLGFIGDRLVMPYRLRGDANLQQWFNQTIATNEELREKTTITVTLPTRGVTMETRLGQCDGCEEFIMKHRELDLQQKASEVKMAQERAKQEELESARYQKRLDANPPNLDNPNPYQDQGSLRLVIRQETDANE
jgi:hypothetical protein